MQIIPQAILDCLTTLNQTSMPKTLVVGLSGGVDSVVLLHALVSLSSQQQANFPAVHAVYINHGLSPNALKWEQFCEGVCSSLGVTFSAINVDIERGARQSLEAMARTARYDALIDYAKHNGAVLLTAHHLDDQLETVLLQLKRGAGPKGLAGMAVHSVMQSVTLLRPLLTVSRNEIISYARSKALHWIEDESNCDEQFDRNFLRQQVLPMLTARWPSLAQTTARSARLCAQQQSLLDEVCDKYLQPLVIAEGQLSVSGLTEYAPRWQLAILRRWFADQSVAMPSEQQLLQIQAAAIAKIDAQPEVSLTNHVIRRFRDTLYCLPAIPCVQSEVDVCLPEGAEVSLPEQRIKVCWSTEKRQNSIALSVTQIAPLTLQTPPLSVKIKPADAAHHKPLKQWCKEWGIPPWERSQVLLIKTGGLPIAVILNRKVVPLMTEGTQRVYLAVADSQ